MKNYKIYFSGYDIMEKVKLWSPERDKQMLDMIEAGVKYRLVGLALGVTKDAIAGRFKRLSNPSTAPRGRAIPAPHVAPVAPLKTPPKPLKPISLSLTLMDLPSGGCKFPTNKYGPPYLFCGLVQQENSSYCDYHTKLTSQSYFRK